MNLVLRSYRFVGDDGAVLIVSECADRDRVLLRMESRPHGDESYSIFLSREDWQTMRALDPFNEAENEMCADFVQTLSFIEDEGGCSTSLELVEVASRDVVYVEMRQLGDRDEDSLSVRLDRSDWYHLIALDVLDPVAARASAESRHPVITDDELPPGQVH